MKIRSIPPARPGTENQEKTWPCCTPSRISFRTGPGLAARSIAKGRVLLWMVPVLAALVASSAEAIDANLTLVGAQQGTFKGEVTTPGRATTIQLRGYSGGLTVAGSGLVSCLPITIRKDGDKTSPLLQRAAYTLETMSTFELRFYRNVGGTDENYLTLTLTGAVLTAFVHAGGEMDSGPVEQLSFGYSAIELEDPIAGVTSSWNCDSGTGS